MSARDELAKVIVAAYGEDAESECPCEQDLDVADTILAAGYSKPRTITTAEELDALPVDSVVGDWTGRVYQKDAEEEAPEFPWWMTTGDQRRYPAKRITLPATVLYEPQP